MCINDMHDAIKVDWLLQGYLSSLFWQLVMQGACVENVLDSVITSLGRDPNRKFVYVEMVSIRRDDTSHVTFPANLEMLPCEILRLNSIVMNL